ncbi:MAG TPA: BrnT family toxin [Stellaceae bacterium]|nr:BrnT family toxin [Stellaceae bacterium]
MLVAGFDWDRANRDKCQKHGVSIDAIEAAFRKPIAVVPDPAHSGVEERFKAIGVTDEGRHILIVFALRIREGETFIRPISARYMHRREVRYYEEAAAKIRDRRGSGAVRRGSRPHRL